jgi:hypothetical protein
MIPLGRRLQVFDAELSGACDCWRIWEGTGDKIEDSDRYAGDRSISVIGSLYTMHCLSAGSGGRRENEGRIREK